MVKAVVVDARPSNQFSELAQQPQKVSKDDEAKKAELKAVELDYAKLKDIEELQQKKLEAQVVKTEEETNAEIETAFNEISEFMQLYNRNVNFSMDEESEKTVIKVFDTESNELIKQFPSDELIELAQKIKGLRQDIDLKSGIFLDEKV
ncbi:flagellar protein FlaG [Thalassotalea sp. 1_MG-2023]|uniref:flagellar protein FlaG n=1 Tax=Thalassotalea sp. 1_MG-2023 TaxID=3062680 RepID=UPI0026E21283|nr:flagellar protein FlaG [Thalassotalea sp. 1_MG-2023]MDO6426444.1 flagellar protein FlaG [Thalassotalea sp. 1_MG-2023]